MCQMCEEYEAELRRMGIAMDEKVTIEVEFDDREMEALQKAADAHGHDVSSEVRAIVRDQVVRQSPKPDDVDFVEEFRRIRAMTPAGVQQTPAWKIIREERDRR